MEWFNDSLKIHSFHYRMNQCFWMNLLNEWFKDKYIFKSPFSPAENKRCTQEFKCLFYITYLILELELMFDAQPYILHTAAEERMEGFTLWLSLSYLTGASHAVRGCPTLAFSSLQLFQRGSCGSYEGQENKSNGTRCISICSLNVNPEFENAPLPKDLRYTFIHYTKQKQLMFWISVLRNTRICK